MREWDHPTGSRIAREAAGQAKETHVRFNNCYANYGATNALMLAELLQDLGQAVAAEPRRRSPRTVLAVLMSQQSAAPKMRIPVT